MHISNPIIKLINVYICTKLADSSIITNFHRAESWQRFKTGYPPGSFSLPAGAHAARPWVSGLDRYLCWVLLPGGYGRVPGATDGLLFWQLSCPVGHRTPLYRQASYYRARGARANNPSLLPPSLPPHTSVSDQHAAETAPGWSSC